MPHKVQLADQIQKSHSLKIDWLMMLKILVQFIYFSLKEESCDQKMTEKKKTIDEKIFQRHE